MNTHAEQSPSVVQRAQLASDGPDMEAPTQLKTASPDGGRVAQLQAAANSSPQVAQLKALQDGANGGGPLQRKVEKRAAGRWISTFDPYTEFPTKVLATQHDKQLRKDGREQIKARVATLYTYTHTKPHCKIGSVPQGPHTVAHRVSLAALTSITTIAEVAAIFDEQVVSPDEAETFVRTDEAPPSGAFSSSLDPRIQRYLDDYESIYDALVLQIHSPTPDVITAKHLLNQLLNMDPYATYGWKSTNSASSGSLAGKGESMANPTFQDLYDKPPSNSFRNDGNLDDFVDHREQMFDEYM